MKIISRDEAISQGLKYYFTGKPCKSGHVASRLVSARRCCECNKEYQSEYQKQNTDRINEQRRGRYDKNKAAICEQAKNHYNKNKGKIAKRIKEYQKLNRDKILEQKKDYLSRNRDVILEQRKEYYEKNKSKIAGRHKEYRKQNPVPTFIRSSLKRIINNWKNGRKKKEDLVGYTFEQLKQRLEFQFKCGMSWENYGEWHIDHKKPISRFIEQGVTDPKIINALSNLQPLWASDNLSKGAKFEI